MSETEIQLHKFRINQYQSRYIDIMPDSKVHGANMGPTWGQQDPGGSHVGHVNLAILDANETLELLTNYLSEIWINFPKGSWVNLSG